MATKSRKAKPEIGSGRKLAQTWHCTECVQVEIKNENLT